MLRNPSSGRVNTIVQLYTSASKPQVGDLPGFYLNKTYLFLYQATEGIAYSFPSFIVGHIVAQQKLGGGFKYVFIFIPIWGRFPI